MSDLENPKENNDVEDKSQELEGTQDPGEQEGLPKVSSEEKYSQKVQERIDDLTSKWRGTDRDLKAAIEKLTERDEEIEVLIEHNRRLVSVVEKGQATPGQRPLDPEDGIKLEIKTTREKMSAARKNLEWDVYDQLEDKLMELNDHLTTVKVKKATAGSNRGNNDGVEAVNKNVVDEFTSENKWFDPKSEEYDPIMRGAALEYDDFLLTKKEWKDKPMAVRLKKVKEEISKRFNKTVSGPPLVEGSKRNERGGDDSITKEFGLSETEKRIADKMIPLATKEERYKEYARQKKM